jgi:uncharacterized protein (DUF58 family)
MIPSRRLVALAAIPALLSLALAVDSRLLPVLLAMDLVLVLLAGVDALWGRRLALDVEREAPAVFSIGRHNPVKLEIRSRTRRALHIELVDDLFAGSSSPDLPLRTRIVSRGRAHLTYRVRPTRRGEYVLGDHHIRAISPLGLWRRQVRMVDKRRVKVYPDVKAVRTYDLLARQQREAALVRAIRRRGGESEFERLREYSKDDEYRSIDWKATARRHKLIAREYQLERNQSVICMLDCGRLMTAETGGLSQLDHALNATLMMAHVAARSGDQVGMLAFADKVLSWVPPAAGAQTNQRIIQASYDLHPDLVDPNYGAAFDLLGARARRRALVILFTQLIDDVSAKTVLSRMRSLLPRHLPLCVLLRDDDVDQLAEPAQGHDKSLDYYVRAAAAETLLWQGRIVNELRAGGALVLNVSPRQLTPALINHYLEIKTRQLL